MQRVFLVVSDLLQSKSFLSKDFPLILEVVHDLDGYLILWLHDIEGENLFPHWGHALFALDDRSGFLVLLHGAFVHDDIDHGLKTIDIEELVVEFTVYYVEGQS